MVLVGDWEVLADGEQASFSFLNFASPLLLFRAPRAASVLFLLVLLSHWSFFSTGASDIVLSDSVVTVLDTQASE